MMIIASLCIDMKLKLYETLVFFRVMHDFVMRFWFPWDSGHAMHVHYIAW
jgi:hypothetical protein